MDKHNGLDLLAQEVGIQPGFYDHRGVFHQVSNETKLTLLQDMGLLSYRRQNEDIFRCSIYVPLTAIGSKAEHVCGFARRAGRKVMVSVCGRFFVTLTQWGRNTPCGPVWTDTFLEVPADCPGRWDIILTGEYCQVRTYLEREVLGVDELFAALPVAFLEYWEGE